MTDPLIDPLVSALRDQIDAADQTLLRALNQRITAVRRLHDHKTAHGYPLSDPGREAAIVAALRAANRGPVADEAVPDIVRAILELTRVEVARLRGQTWS